MGSDDVERTGARLGELFETLRAFAEVATDYPLLLDTVAERIGGFMGEGCTIYLATDDGKWLDAIAFYNSDAAVLALTRATFSGGRVDVAGETLSASVMRTGEVAVVPFVSAEVIARTYARYDFAAVTKSFEAVGLQSLMLLPLQVCGKRLGVLVLSRHRAGGPDFDREDVAFARTLADTAALAISNAMLVEAQKRELDERRRAEAETRKFVALVQHSRDFIAMASFDGRVLFVNAAGRELVGIAADRDVTAIQLAEFHTDAGMLRAPLVRDKGYWEGEGQLRHFETGELIPTQVSSFLLRGPNDEPLGFSTVQRDLRETRRLEEHLRQVQKMEAIGRLSGGVAHDFNNLLSVILSYSWLLLDSLPAGSPIRDEIREIQTAGERASALTQQLLAFSRQQVLELRVANLDEIICGMSKLTQRLLGEDIELSLKLGGVAGNVRVDRGQIEQVILNLTVNARDAMPDGGKLTLATDQVSVEDGEVCRRAGLSPGRYVVLTVIDTGVGIDAAILTRIFDPFFTTKPIGKGTGLGLATVFGIVKQSGGYIGVASEVGKGTTFTIYLPRCDEALAAPTAAVAVAHRVHEGATILLVEDDPQVRVLMRGILKRAGYRVLDAAGPIEAIRDAERFSGDIDLLVTDVVMPTMNGRKLAEHLAISRPRTKVIYVSGYTDDAMIARRVSLDGVVLLQKPVTPTTLLDRIAAILDGP